MKVFLFAFIIFCFQKKFYTQVIENTAWDTTIIEGRMIVLSEVVAGKKLKVADLINILKNDTSFYKAFKNLRISNYKSSNVVWMKNKKNEKVASLKSITQQIFEKNCRTMKTISEEITGDMKNANGEWNYYTMDMYASLFFTNGTVCNENNIINDPTVSTSKLKGMSKHKAQLKKLFFNPGQKITGLPFLSNKTEIFANNLAARYNFLIDIVDFNGTECYYFKITVKPGYEDDVAINEMTTWFNCDDFQVMKRNYNLSYKAVAYDFNVTMNTEIIKHSNGLYMPKTIHYLGDWKAITKKREKGEFAAVIFDVN